MNNGLFSSFPVKISNHPIETEVEKEKTELIEKDLKTDSLNQLERRILIALHTYGLHDLSRAAQWTGLSEDELISELRTNKNIRNSIENEEIPCWTKAELISRLCVEAETAPRANERITAITKLMEFRGLAAPEGGAKSFTRTIARFRKME
jgi:hypothetical protein